MAGVIVRFRNWTGEKVSQEYGPFPSVHFDMQEDSLRVMGHPEWPAGRDFATWLSDDRQVWRVHGIPEEPKVEVSQADALTEWHSVEIYAAQENPYA